MQKFLLITVASALTLVFAGCANAVRTYDDTEDQIDRTTIGTKRMVIVPEKLDNFEFDATAATVNKQKVKRYQAFIHGELVTPYDGWRECYEIPAGLALVPVSLCSHILSVFTFGVYPFSFSNDITDLAYSGLNPCLNWESETRSEKHPLETSRKLVDEQEEDTITPIPNAEIILTTGESSRSFKTNEFGVVKLKFVGLDNDEAIFHGDRNFDFKVKGNTEVTNKVISRDFATKLLRARAAIMRYDASPSGKKLVQAVKTLEELKFTGLAYQLEKRELGKHKKDAAFIQEFNDMSLE